MCIYICLVHLGCASEHLLSDQLTCTPCLQAEGQSAVEQAEAAAQAVAEAEEAAALATRLMDVANRYEEEAQLAGGTRLMSGSL